MGSAFVYCWTDMKTRKLYVGSHKGAPDDGYVCSSKHMLAEYKERPRDFVRQIIATGDVEDIRKLESTILKAVDAMHNDSFYNKHNNDGFYFEGWVSGTHTEEHKRNMSIAASKRKRTAEHLQKLHEGRRNSKNSPEHQAAVVASRIGSKHTEESKQKMSVKRKNNQEYKALKSQQMKAVWAKRKEGLANGC